MWMLVSFTQTGPIYSGDYCNWGGGEESGSISAYEVIAVEPKKYHRNLQIRLAFGRNLIGKSIKYNSERPQSTYQQ